MVSMRTSKNGSRVVLSLFGARNKSADDVSATWWANRPRGRFEGVGSSEIYGLVLVSCLLLCLLVVIAVYANLYLVIRRAQRFRLKATQGGFSGVGQFAVGTVFATVAADRAPPPPPPRPRPHHVVARTVSVDEPTTDNDNQRQQRPPRHRHTINDDTQPQSSSSALLGSSSQHRRRVKARMPAGGGGSSPNLLSTATGKKGCSPARSLSSSRRSRGSRNRQNNLLQRYKCIVVILTVCLINLAYLSVYFSLQLLHIIHVVRGVSLERLRERYILNFVLRALFVSHALLNPIIFFRIKSVRLTFYKLLQSLGCCTSTIQVSSTAHVPPTTLPLRKKAGHQENDWDWRKQQRLLKHLLSEEDEEEEEEEEEEEKEKDRRARKTTRKSSGEHEEREMEEETARLQRTLNGASMATLV